MLMLPFLLTPACEGLFYYPQTKEEWNLFEKGDKNIIKKYELFNIFCNLQLNRPMDAGDHFYNAKILYCFADLIESRFEVAPFHLDIAGFKFKDNIFDTDVNVETIKKDLDRWEIPRKVDFIFSKPINENIKLTPWIVDEYCAMRCIEGTDINNVANRIAYIEKTPRIRFKPFTNLDDENYERKWFQGPKGQGGCDGHIPENELYGFYPPSREWCDKHLKIIGYQLGE